MIFHIAVCSPDAGLRSGLERQCMEFFARRADACIVEHLPDTDALLRKDGEGVRYDLYLLELSGSATPVGLAAAGELRRRGRRAPLAFVVFYDPFLKEIFQPHHSKRRNGGEHAVQRQ